MLRGVGLAGSGYALTQLITLATYLVLARLTSPLAFGQYAEAAVLVGVGLLFTESGMLAALIQRRERIDEAANTALVATLASGVAVSLLALAAAPLIGLFFRSDTVGAVAAAISGQLFLRSATVVPNAMLERELAFLRRTVVEPLAAVAFAAAAIVAMANGMGVWGLVIGNYVQIAVDAALTWALARWRPRPRLASLGDVARAGSLRQARDRRRDRAARRRAGRPGAGGALRRHLGAGPVPVRAAPGDGPVRSHARGRLPRPVPGLRPDLARPRAPRAPPTCARSAG